MTKPPNIILGAEHQSMTVGTRNGRGLKICALLLAAALAGCSPRGIGALPGVLRPAGESEWVSSTDNPPETWPAAVKFIFGDPLRIAADTSLWKPAIHVSDGARTWVVTGDSLRPIHFRQETRWYRTRDSDSLSIEVQVKPLAGGHAPLPVRVELPLRNDFFWWVSVAISKYDTCRPVIACNGAKSVPLYNAANEMRADSLWVSWGWGRISNPNVMS